MAKAEEIQVRIARTKPRSQAEMAALYTSVFPATHRLAYLLCGNLDTADELAQEAFVRAYARISNLKDVGAVEAYLRQTVLNLVRGKARRWRIEQLYGHLFLQERDPISPESPLPDEQLWAELLQLPLRQRAAVILRYHSDLSERQTADALDCSVNAVKSLLGRGMRTLRAAMKERQDDAS